MGNKPTKTKTIESKSNTTNTNTNKKPTNFAAYSNRHKFVPLFTTQTLTVVQGYSRLTLGIVPAVLTDLIYKYIKNNCTFIIIFESDSATMQHSYLHEVDVESGTNQNLTKRFDHPHDIWYRNKEAAYCYGEYNEKETIFRVGGDSKPIGCILKTGKTFHLPQIESRYHQLVYSKNTGLEALYMIGGANNGKLHTKSIQRLDLEMNRWKPQKLYSYKNIMTHINKTYNSSKKMKYETFSMIIPRWKHLSLFYDSYHSTISDKIFTFGGTVDMDSSPDCYSPEEVKSAECFDVGTNEISIISTNGGSRIHSGGCIDKETDKVLIAGGISTCSAKSVQEFDFVKQQWSRIGDSTNFCHRWYPKVTKNNQVVVVFGNSGYEKGKKDYGYVEYIDTRDSTKQWIVLSSLRELLEFSGQQVRDGFFQHILQM